jgi:hypothetical protein
MGTLTLALILRPVIALVLLALIVRPICYVVWKLIPDGKIKRILFSPIAWPRQASRR